MKESHIIELQKAYKKYEVFKVFHHVLMWTGVILIVCIIVLVRGHIRFYIGLVDLLLGSQMLITRKKMKNISNRIREIESMYEKKSFENYKR